MFEIDEEFLERVGLGSLPEDVRKKLLVKYQDDLEVMIGRKVSESLSESKFYEFEKVIDGDEETIKEWLDKSGDYKNDEVYKKILSAHGSETEAMLEDYVAAKWLNKNCPQYGDIVMESAKEISDDIISRKDVILWEHGKGM